MLIHVSVDDIPSCEIAAIDIDGADYSRRIVVVLALEYQHSEVLVLTEPSCIPGRNICAI